MNISRDGFSGRTRSRFIIIIVIVVFAVLAGTAGYFFKQYKDLKNNPNAVVQATTKRIIANVSGLYLVPTDEEPTVAEIKDKDKLKDQAFFKSAENGDHILIYGKAKMAIIYRERINKLVNVGPVTTGSDNGSQTNPTSPKP